jgi:hypothetical protein
MVDEKVVVRRDGKPDLRFQGELLASASSSDDRQSSSYSGELGRWVELQLWQTRGGKYVCQEIRWTRWQGEEDRYQAEVCTDAKSMAEFFGHSWLAKLIYARTGLDALEDVD